VKRRLALSVACGLAAGVLLGWVTAPFMTAISFAVFSAGGRVPSPSEAGTATPKGGERS
jgi:hypothetical protein